MGAGGSEGSHGLTAPGLELDRAVLTAHLASGALWITGFFLAAPDLGVGLAAVAVAYVLLASLARASRRLRTGRTLLACWAVAALLLTALLVPLAGWFSPVLGVLVGSVPFGAWAVTGAFLTQVLDGSDAVDATRLDPR